MELVFVGDRCNDHSPSSGYDQVCSIFPDAAWLSGRALEAGRIDWHRAPKGPSTAPRIFHVIYGDCSGKALPGLLRERFGEAKIISSVHRPVSRLAEDRAACSALGASDAILAISNVQARELKSLQVSASVYTVPHGVWTQVFRPVSAVSSSSWNHVMLIGSFLRDWAGAKQVIETLEQAGVRTIALGAGPREHLAAGDSPVEVLPRVSESELANLYHRSAAVFLPFLDATASNALLEAMAAGCPVICPHLPSLLDYLPDDTDTYKTGRYDLAATRILRYVQSSSDREARAKELMKRAGQFDWLHLQPRYQAAYMEVASSFCNAITDQLPAWDTVASGTADLP